MFSRSSSYSLSCVNAASPSPTLALSGALSRIGNFGGSSSIKFTFPLPPVPSCSSSNAHIHASLFCSRLGFSWVNRKNIVSRSRSQNRWQVPASVDALSSTLMDDDNDDLTEIDNMKEVGSGTTARSRRLLKIREDKRKREFDRLHNYPAWAKVLEEACKNDAELRAVLGDSIGEPELMRKRVEERVRKKGREFQKSKTGSVVAFKVSFRDFNPIGSHIWFELYGSPSDKDVDLIGSVIQAWYVMGRLGAFNSSNLQLANMSMEYNPLYDADKGFKVMPSSFHDIGDVEFQDNWGRVWVDLGTSDFFSIDVLLNCFTALSSEYLGIQQVVFGGRHMGDWEEGMTSPDYGYKFFKI